ncbi:hypothetical protein I317_04626 [Kwoniella heveanensis CBS 569]|nr:hypothetical protein I317_04626 [Kwoniella heveanensis CBS 569]
MGLAGRKDKQRIGYDPRNLTWSDDKNRFSYKHMTSLGWSDNSGLGSGLSGNPNHIAVVRKLDNGGIGMDRARKDGDDVAANYGQAGRGLEDVLKRLAGGSASPSPAPSPAPEEKEQEQKVLRNRIASRQKHLNAKRMASQSPAALAEILGVPLSSLPASPSPGGSASSTPAPESQPEASSSTSTTETGNERTADETVKPSTLSVADYFKQKMREKMLARQAAASANGQPSSVKVEDLPASSLERISDDPKKPVGGTAWEGTKMAFAEPEVAVEFNPSDRPVTPPLEELDEKAAKKARKEAKRLAKAQAQAKADGVDSPAPEHDPIHDAAEVIHHFEHIGETVETDKDKKKREKDERKRRKEAKKAELSRSGSDETPKADKKRKREEDVDEAKSKKDKKDKKEKGDKKETKDKKDKQDKQDKRDKKDKKDKKGKGDKEGSTV